MNVAEVAQPVNESSSDECDTLMEQDIGPELGEQLRLWASRNRISQTDNS